MNYIRGIILIFITGLILYGYTEHRRASYFQAESIRIADNMKAYESEKNTLIKANKMYRFTIAELLQSNDSINKKLLATAKKLKIKEKNIQGLQYHSSIITKTDTVVMSDTIFRNKYVNVDTILGDKWYSIKLGLKYPSTVIATPKFVSEKYIIVNKTREYNKPPSKIFFIRWFQRKHDVLKIDVKEENPYIINGEQRFIEIIK